MGISEKDEPEIVSGVGIWEHFTVRDGLPDMKIESLVLCRRDN